MKTSRVRYFKTFPGFSSGSSEVRVAVVDRTLLRRIPKLGSWLESFDLVLPVDAGEKLKTLKSLERELTRLLLSPVSIARGGVRLFAVGGGSVGDFTGFLASVLFRGVELIQVPTTWLSAIDSAHGGKTALNVAGIKNSIGTFHPASEVWLIRNFFIDQPDDRVTEALGEAAKMALLDRRVWAASTGRGAWTADRLWKLLPELISAKLRVVARDPSELLGHRRILNLGHTLGHALEARSTIPHGRAVAVGLYFSLWVSWCEGWMSSRNFFALEKQLSEHWRLDASDIRRYRMGREELRTLLLRDKKRSDSGSVIFVGLRGVGRPVQMPLTFDRLLDHAEEFWG